MKRHIFGQRKLWKIHHVTTAIFLIFRSGWQVPARIYGRYDGRPGPRRDLPLAYQHSGHSISGKSTLFTYYKYH